jgi:ribosome biogenesis protein Nip4
VGDDDLREAVELLEALLHVEEEDNSVFEAGNAMAAYAPTKDLVAEEARRAAHQHGGLQVTVQNLHGRAPAL